MELSAQSNDSNAIEDLRSDVKSGAAIARPNNDTELWDIFKNLKILFRMKVVGGQQKLRHDVVKQFLEIGVI